MMSLDAEDIAYLKKLRLFTKYENRTLTILEVAKARKITLARIKEEFRINQYPVNFKGDTIADDLLLKRVLLVKKIWVKKRQPKTNVKPIQTIGNQSPKPKNKMLRKNWEARDEELKAKALNPKAIIITTPMGNGSK